MESKLVIGQIWRRKRDKALFKVIDVKQDYSNDFFGQFIGIDSGRRQYIWQDKALKNYQLL